MDRAERPDRCVNICVGFRCKCVHTCTCACIKLCILQQQMVHAQGTLEWEGVSRLGPLHGPFAAAPQLALQVEAAPQ